MEETVSSTSNGETPAETAESKFAAVVFHNIQEVYIPGKDIRCCYSIKPFVSPTANDWIGLYKVGWQSYKDYLCYEYSPVIQKQDMNVSESLSSQNSVLFCGSKLPQEETEFYQFCYVTSDGEIRGASYPFQIQFSKPGELECNEEEDENGDTLVVVRNRTTMLEDSLAKAFDENAALKASKENSEKDCRLYQDMILQLESQKNTINTAFREQAKATDKVNSEKISLEESLNASAEKVERLEQTLQDARSQSLELHKCVEVEKLRFTQTDEDQKKLGEERVQLLQDVSDGKREVEMLQDVKEKSNCKIKDLEEKNKKIRQESDDLINEHENMLHEIKSIQATFDESKQGNLAMERSLSDQLEHMNLLKKENYQLKQELDDANEKIDELSASFKDERDEVVKTHLEEIRCLEVQTEKLLKKIQDGERALGDAEETIQKILGEFEEEKEMHQQFIEEYDNTISTIQGQLDQERAFNNSLSTASDQQVAELQELLNVQLEKTSTACQKIEVKSQKIRQLKEEIKAKEKMISNLEESINEGKHELAKSQEHEHLLSNAEKTSEKCLDGPYFALQTAHGQLKKQYLQAKEDMESLWRQKSDLKRQLATLQSELPDSDLRLQMGNLKKQIEDLRIRLNMGAEAYKVKFKECRKYQNQLKKVQKTVSGSSTPQSPVSEFEICNVKQCLEDEKKEACETKEELKQTKIEKEALQRKCFDIEKELAIYHEEKEKRLIEDKELQSHIECLHRELLSRTDAMKTAEENFQKTTEKKENTIAALIEENKNLAMESDGKNLMTENEVLQEEVLKQKKMVEDLYTELLLFKNRDAAESTAQPAAAVLTDESSCEQSPGLMSLSQNVCPVCSIFYPPNFSQENFESHVQSHFSD